MTSVSRRTFLGTAAAASVSAVAAPAMAASTSGNNLPAKWDDTVDVVVLGCGGAGMMAACQAHDAGGKVAVYDAGQSPFHTATNLCGGLFTAVVAVRIRIHLGCFLSYGLIGLMANQAIFCCCIVRKVGMHRRIFQLSLGAHAESGCAAECCGKAQKSLNFHMFSP